MEDNLQFNPSAFKHGFTEADIRKVIETKIYEGQLEDFVNKYTIIGFDPSGNLLEIMYNIIDSESVNIFHAMKCRKSVIKQIKGKRGDVYGAND
jgi:uncharacterized protein YvpB